MATSIRIKRLTSGWYHIRDTGPCEWAQVQQWPECTEEELESAYFPEASPDFRREVAAIRERLLEGEIDGN